MNRFKRQIRIGFLVGILPLATFGALTPKPVLVGKFIAANVQGSVSYVSEDRILDLKKGDTIPAAGTTIETSAHAKVTLLFSNRTSLVVDENTRLRIEKFDQEFFLRSDDPKTEPSKSLTTIALQSGRVVVNASALHNGTSMIYRTSQADVAVLAERVVITANDEQTVVAVLSGAAAVRNTQGRSSSPDTGVRLSAGQSIRIPTRINFTSSARPALSPAIATLSSPSQAGLDESSTTLAAAVRTSVLASPASAASIAAKATNSAPEKASIITYSAVKAAPEQAPQIAFAVIQALQSSSTSDRSQHLKTVSAVTAAAVTAAPERAGFITASTVQALLQNPLAPSSADERIELASTIAALVAAAAPGSASDITSAALAALASAPPNASGSNQQLALTAARIVAAVARVSPAESESIGVAAVRWVMQTATNPGQDELTDAAGLIAAVAAQTSAERAIAINAGIASATNLSLTTLQASAARSTAVAAQIGQQLGGILQNAAFALQQVSNFGPNPNGPRSDGVVNDAVFRPDDAAAAATLTNATSDAAAGADPFSPPQITPFDPTLLGNLAGDLAAAPSAQDGFVFDVGTTPDGTPTVVPAPTVPANLPVEFVTSPANG